MNERLREAGTTVVDRAKWQQTRIILLWNADWSYDQIAREFGLGIGDVESFLQSQPGWPDIIKMEGGRPVKELKAKRVFKTQIIRELATKGWSIKEIARHTGICEEYCRNVRDSMLRSQGRMTPKRKLRAQAFNYFAHHPSLSPAQIARELNTSINYIYNLQAQFRKASHAKLDT